MYTVYKVTNNLTRDFYIGVHKTTNPNDGYLGSGKVIRQQVALHGPENFTKEILLITEVKRDAYHMEEELVRPLLGAPGCLNLHPGGHGGFGYLNKPGGAGDIGRQRSKERATHLAASRHCKMLYETDPEFRSALQATSARNLLIGRARGQYLEAAKKGNEVWVGRKHSPESLKRISETRRGPANGSFGSQWLYNETTGESKRVKADDIDKFKTMGWVPGRRCTR